MKCLGFGVFAWLGLAAAPPALGIENWSVTDLGSARTESICIEAATAAFVDYSNVFGARDVMRSSWTAYAYGLNKADHDAVITCTFSTANATRATLIIYSKDSIQGGLVAARLTTAFEEYNRRLEKDWIEKALSRNGF